LAGSYALNRVSRIDTYFETHGFVRNIVAACDGMAAIPGIIAARPIVALLPAVVARGLRESRELAVEPIAGRDLQISVGLVWHRRLDSSNTHRYIRDWLKGELLATKTIHP
jgi:DNA-binding transcriptional LysR family regulator